MSGVTLNEALIGKEYPSVTFTVEGDHVRRFAAAVGDDRAYTPPTFVTAPEIAAMAQVVGDPELGLDFTRVVHGEQEYEWHRPLAVGDVLSVTPRIAGIQAKGGHEFLVVETELRDAHGELVVLARNTLISRGTAGGA